MFGNRLLEEWNGPVPACGKALTERGPSKHNTPFRIFGLWAVDEQPGSYEPGAAHLTLLA
jgi:hypothetical protein